MKEPQDLVINEWTKGIAQSPFEGTAVMQNCDIYLNPGVLQIGYLPTKKSNTGAGAISALPKWIVKDPNTLNYYALASDGTLWKSTSGSSWAAPAHLPANTGNGQGIAVWKNYVFVLRSTAIDVMKIADDTWTDNWQTGLTADTAFHPAVAGQDDILYWGHGRYMASVQETSGSTFAPGTAASYTYTAQALTLPAGYIVKCLAEFGKLLMIGTCVGTQDSDFRTADIFPWDRSSTSFNLPIRLFDNGVNQMVTVANQLYIQAGVYGTIYVYNGYLVQELKQLRNIVYGTATDLLESYPGAIMFFDGKIMFGHVYSGLNAPPNPTGVWGLRGDVLTYENQISTGNSGNGANGQLAIGCLFPGSNAYFIGWQDGTTYGIDLVSVRGNTRYTSYQAQYQSSLYQVGTPLFPRTFQQCDIMLAQPMVAGHGVRVSYRKNTSDSWTVIGTFDYATYSSVSQLQQITLPAQITDAVSLQIKIELTTDSGNSTSPLLREVRLR